MAWDVIVDEELRGMIEALVRTYVAGAISVHPVPSLASGHAGAALFFASVALELDDEAAQDRCVHALEHALESVSSVPSNACLLQGVVGVAWLLHHMHQRGLLDPQEEATSEIEALLSERLRNQTFPVYGLFDGLVGLGVYGLERFHSEWARNFLPEVVGQLSALAVETAQGMTWRNLPDPPKGGPLPPLGGAYNLGLAHGVPGVVVVLARCAAAGIRREEASRLARSGADWVLAQQKNGTFPELRTPRGPPAQSWEGWGAGSAGIGLALLSAGRLLGEARLEQQGVQILRGVAEQARHEVETEDVGIWFGSAGLAHTFQRAFHATGEPVFRQVALTWLERTLRFARHEQGDVFWVAEGARCDHFFSGGLGAGLVLLSAISSREPTWDRLLLADVPGTNPRA